MVSVAIVPTFLHPGVSIGARVGGLLAGLAFGYAFERLLVGRGRPALGA
jgi:membrane associated rhomboid family serine protease